MNKKLEDYFDSFNQSETDELIDDIHNISINKEKAEKIKKTAMIMAGVSYEKGNNRIISKRSKLMTKIVACAVIFVVIGSVGVAATSSLEKFKVFFTGETDKYEEQILKTIQTKSNGNFVMSLDGIISDNYQCMCVLNLDALNKEGQKALSRDAIYFLKVTVDYTDGTRSNVSRRSGNGVTYSNHTLSYNEDINKSNKHKSYVLNINTTTLGITNMREVKQVTIEFDNISMSFNISEYINVEYLYSKSKTKNEIKDVEISPIGFSLSSNQEIKDISFILKNGDLDHSVPIEYGYSDEVKTGTPIFGDYCWKIINLDKYIGLRINGVNYYKQKIESKP